MTLIYVLGLIIVSGLLGVLSLKKWRDSLLLGVCTLTIYIFQPSLPIRGLGFWLPSITLILVVLAWLLVTPRDMRAWKINWLAIFIIGIVVIGVGLTRYLDLPFTLIPTIPPSILTILFCILGFAGIFFIVHRLISDGKKILGAAIAFLIIVFILLKTPQLTTWVSGELRAISGQSKDLAAPFDIRWLGFSYIAFRIIHTLRDRLTGKLPIVSLNEYVVYVLFFPTITAGPIDRLERFIGDYRKRSPLSSERVLMGGKRLVFGLFKKFILADSLAIIALNTGNALQVKTAGWTWMLVYAYSFQILFDFSGYTDLAIGMGELIGITLPENFNKPYLKSNLTRFWNSWHMTLTQWFRAYFFNPLTRALRSRNKPISIPAIVLITQISTMGLIGLWHGVTLNYLIWGLWHGMGLFIQNRWSDWIGSRTQSFSIGSQKFLNAAGVFLTFNYVALGWVFFALDTPQSSFLVLSRLFGLS